MRQLALTRDRAEQTVRERDWECVGRIGRQRVIGSEASRGQLLGERARPGDLLEQPHPLLVLDAVRLHLGDRLAAGGVLLGDEEIADVLLDTADNVTLLPATIDLAGAEALLLMRPGREYALKRALAEVAEDFDVILIDCPPSLGVLTLNGLTAADEVIVPLQCETLAHRGVGQLLRTVNEVQQITNPNLTMLGAVATLFDARTTHSRDVLSDVSDRYDLPVIEPPIPRTVRFAEAPAAGRSILDTARSSKGAQAYREVTEAILAAI